MKHLPATGPAGSQIARHPTLPRPEPKPKILSLSPQNVAAYAATNTHTLWDNHGCLSPRIPHEVSGIYPVKLLDKDK